MKNSLHYGMVILLLVISCKKNDQDVFFKIGKDLEYKFTDIALYDTSANIMYFKSVRDEFKDIEKNTFMFLDNNDEIYSGFFWPGYMSSIPTGPFIYSPPSMFGNYALEIENWYAGKPDLRKDPRMISLLEQNKLLHSGLAISTSSIEITGSQLTYKFTITNHDQTDLLILDPDKTGPNLFHYFTNGLNIKDLSYNEVFTSNFQVRIPTPWNSFEIGWLTLLKSGESKHYTINYIINTPLSPGNYNASFAFPGLSNQVPLDQLYQGNSRIWLGEVQITQRLTIE
jgi:hypothetical protein